MRCCQEGKRALADSGEQDFMQWEQRCQRCPSEPSLNKQRGVLERNRRWEADLKEDADETCLISLYFSCDHSSTSTCVTFSVYRNGQYISQIQWASTFLKCLFPGWVACGHVSIHGAVQYHEIILR